MVLVGEDGHVMWIQTKTQRDSFAAEGSSGLAGNTLPSLMKPKWGSGQESIITAKTLAPPPSPHPPLSRRTTRTMMSESEDFLDSPEAEVSLFRSIMRTRPVGIHRHAHILAVHNSIYRDTGYKVPMQDLWAKLGKMYDLDTLEHGVGLPLPLNAMAMG
jgi:hypothetical protein